MSHYGAMVRRGAFNTMLGQVCPLGGQRVALLCSFTGVAVSPIFHCIYQFFHVSLCSRVHLMCDVWCAPSTFVFPQECLPSMRRASLWTIDGDNYRRLDDVMMSKSCAVISPTLPTTSTATIPGESLQMMYAS